MKARRSKAFGVSGTGRPSFRTSRSPGISVTEPNRKPRDERSIGELSTDTSGAARCCDRGTSRPSREVQEPTNEDQSALQDVSKDASGATPLEDVMHTNTQTRASAPAATAGTRRRPADRWFYVGVTSSVILLNVVSFGPSIIDPSARTVPLPLTSIDLAHVLVSVAWLLVFLAQVTLIATGRPAVHRRVGVLGVLLSGAFIVVTWLMLVEGAGRGFDLSGDLVPRGTTVDPGTFLAPAHALVPFGVFVAAAVWYRRRPAVHKRLMMLAMVSTTGAPVVHLIGHWQLAFLVFPVSQIMLLSLLFIHDRRSQGRLHPVSLWGVVSFAWTPLFFSLIAPTSAWHTFAAWIIS
jgi:hypothetical protein